MLKVKYIVLFTLFLTNIIDQPAPEVTVEQGILSGIISSDGTFFQYLGIPYATANSSNRFQAPFPPSSWEGVYKAVDSTTSCPQKLITIASGEENCLKLNIYVPVRANKPLPVMFYIHGGAFIMGSGGKELLGPEFLVKQDVILVTINYRLGPLGFLCLGIKEAPGNAGLKDQLAALKWVKKNIAAFGGDPENITIFGESAGGASVSMFLASNTTQGLFKRAIVQSGSSIASWPINRSPIDDASVFVKQFGYDTKDPYEIYNILSKTSIENLVTTKTGKNYTFFFDPLFVHLPCIEKYIPGVEPFLPDLPYKLLEKNLKNISLMYGTTSREGLFLITEDTEKTLSEKNEVLPFASDLQFKSKAIAENIALKIRQHYFRNEPISLKNAYGMEEYYTQVYFEIPSLLEAQHIISKSNTTIYNYYFDYSGYRNILKIVTGNYKEKGACHVDEMLYLFDGYIWPVYKTKSDMQVVTWMTKMWTNFAKYGNPTPDSDQSLPIKWKPSDITDLRVLYISNDLKMGPIPNPESFKLWRDIYSNHRKLDITTPTFLGNE